MLTQTTMMIYPTKDVAAQIAEALTKEEGVEFSYAQVTTGWQVAKVTKCPSAMPPWPPLPYKKKSPLETSPALKDAWAAKDGVSMAPVGQSGVGSVNPAMPSVVVKLKLQSESPKYMNVYLPDGTLTSFGKTTLLDWEIQKDVVNHETWALLKMPTKTAKKRGVMDSVVA